MKKVLAGIGTLAFGLTLAAGSALAQSQTTNRPSRSAHSSLASAPYERPDVSQTYPMGISSPAFGPGVSGGAR